MILKLFMMLFLLLALMACDEDDNGVSPVLSDIALIGKASPEDIVVYNNFLYTSHAWNASVLRVDLYNPANVITFIPPSTDANRPSGWGLCVMPSRNWLLSIVNPLYDFQNFPAHAGEVRAYDLTTGVLQRTWVLPGEGTPTPTVGNAVLIDNQDKIYVGDITRNTRLIRIDPVDDSVTVWFEDPINWPQTGWGVAGMVFDQDSSLYISARQDKLWRLPINPDGTPGSLQIVTLTNAPANINADGMTWAGNHTLYYSQNDSMMQGSHGIVYKVELTSPTTGNITSFAESLKDPSGVYAASFFDIDYLFVEESQFGHDFGVDPGDPTYPYRVLVFRR